MVDIETCYMKNRKINLHKDVCTNSIQNIFTYAIQVFTSINAVRLTVQIYQVLDGQFKFCRNIQKTVSYVVVVPQPPSH